MEKISGCDRGERAGPFYEISRSPACRTPAWTFAGMTVMNPLEGSPVLFYNVPVRRIHGQRLRAGHESFVPANAFSGAPLNTARVSAAAPSRVPARGCVALVA